MNTSLLYEFPLFKLADFSEEDFKDSENPWAWVMKAALAGIKSNWNDEILLNMKVQVYREFREKGYSIKKTRAFLQFIKYYARFAKREFFSKFDNEIQSVDQKKDSPMGIIELVKQHIVEEARLEGLEKGMEQGLEQGMQQGLQQGMQQGMQQGLQQGVQQGMQQGMQQGLTKGELLKARKVAVRLLEKHPEWSDLEIAELIEMPVSFILQVRQELLQGN